jgi:hypothetical protein
MWQWSMMFCSSSHQKEFSLWSAVLVTCSGFSSLYCLPHAVVVSKICISCMEIKLENGKLSLQVQHSLWKIYYIITASVWSMICSWSHVLCFCLSVTGRSIITKKSDGSQVKESTDSSTTLEDDDIKGKQMRVVPFFIILILVPWKSL